MAAGPGGPEVDDDVDSPVNAVAQDLRTVSTPAASLTDLVMVVKPDDASQLRIRLYDSTTGRTSPAIPDPQRSAADGSGAWDGFAPSSAAAAWWALETRLSSSRLPGHTVTFGNDLRVAPAGAGGAPGGDTANGRTSTFIEDRTTLWSGITVFTGMKQLATDAEARSIRSWLALEARPRDGMTVRYVQGDADRSSPAAVDPLAPTPTRTAVAADTRGVGNSGGNSVAKSAGQSVAVEQRVSSSDRWTLSAFDSPAGAAGASGLSLPGNAAEQRHRGVRLAAVRATPDGSRVSVDYLALRPVPPSGDSAADGGGGLDGRSTAQFGRLAAALPLEGHWRLGAETVVVGRYGTTPGYGLTHLVLESSALDPRTTLSLHIYDVLDRRPADLGASTALQPASATTVATPMPEGRGVRLALGVPF